MISRRPTPEYVVREHGPMVHRHLQRIFGPRADVDDLFQNVFVEVLRSLPRFEGRSRLSTWIRRITWNVAYQEMRLRYRSPAAVVFDEERVAHGELRDVEAGVEGRDAMRRLYAGLERLEPKQRMAVVMHDIEGLTLKEIGRALGRPLQTVASQLHAGRARLSAWMRDDRPVSSQGEGLAAACNKTRDRREM
jgi:RNA polymerase sigma-70 factor (ECF subfamily)